MWFCDEIFGCPIVGGLFGMTVGVDGAEELPELGFICGCFELLENGSADMMPFSWPLQFTLWLIWLALRYVFVLVVIPVKINKGFEKHLALCIYTV